MEECKQVDTSDIEKQVLLYLNDHGEISNTETYEAQAKIAKDLLDPVLKSLLVEGYVALEVLERKEIELTEEGLGYA